MIHLRQLLRDFAQVKVVMTLIQHIIVRVHDVEALEQITTQSYEIGCHACLLAGFPC